MTYYQMKDVKIIGDLELDGQSNKAELKRMKKKWAQEAKHPENFEDMGEKRMRLS